MWTTLAGDHVADSHITDAGTPYDQVGQISLHWHHFLKRPHVYPTCQCSPHMRTLGRLIKLLWKGLDKVVCGCGEKDFEQHLSEEKKRVIWVA